jgi:bifunctional non-homologous end joining protein LigD
VAAPLRTYRTKRDFDVTSEPRGGAARSRAGNAFVVQKHAARRLHYDLRLELDGAMKSWAVTRGPSLVPEEKRLAVHVEDHPIEYNKFEGSIPRGEYGGGTVMIWDRGRWFPEGDPHQGYAKGHLSFRLAGKKLTGGWHLVRMRKRPGERQESWLLIKAHDEAARTEKDPDILAEQQLSEATGRTMEEIAAGAKRRKPSQPAAGAVKQSPARAAKPKSTASARARVKKKPGDNAVGPAQLPAFVPPSLALACGKPPNDAAFVHEIKFDGYRIQARLDRGEVTLLTRQGLDWTEKFAPIARSLAELAEHRALIDGEVVSQDDHGVSSFSLLQQDLKASRTDRFIYYGFDLLHLDGHDLTGEPLLSRKQVLQQLLAGLSDAAPVRLSEHFTESGSLLLKHACQMGLEGIVSKRLSAPYRSGRFGDWLKAKCSFRQEFVVAGYAPSSVDPRSVGALILAYYDGKHLRYAGRAGSGYTHEMGRELWKRLQPLRVERVPFDRTPEEETATARNAKWVAPRLVVDVAFRGWTHGDVVRHAAFLGLREDKDASEVVREDMAMPAVRDGGKIAAKENDTTNAGKSAAKTRPPKGSAKVEVAGVALSHPDRVYWDDVGVTKQALAQFYVEIWDWISPHLVGRPLALVRCPQGAGAQCFFQKHTHSTFDRNRLRVVQDPDGDEVMAIDRLDGLISLVQAGVLEIHTRGTTIERMEACDRLVFDLDPGPGTQWSDIVAAAREVRQRLADLRLTSFLKTSGGKGLHVVLPIKPTPWEAAKNFAREIAEQMARDDAARYTANVKKSTREKRIFVDYLRNSREATAVAPYSTRARPGAPVSTPISWDELASVTSASRYTVLNLHQRLARLRKDPWADIGKLAPPLPNKM